ncbi:hypothetical protein PUNSTDRAFT_52549 [Punctularia strigosozonata HHB-11173 SS5]|uniref:uncharacterized protein n=1 Tax=Punctularia strigosozonata (strain HHB-11173) TaxID=741275 RepID=UPI0004417B80|nr:uncharacterized protein PUNSTDRAFT_52549 [Punctularia strigosozonata HHB-11173 SS5]EIN09206.1 hypothetical protein PUNSTDRAFT_52549 [Punctularia strigosozonata HHB-11173 SS5]
MWSSFKPSGSVTIQVLNSPCDAQRTVLRSENLSSKHIHHSRDRHWGCEKGTSRLKDIGYTRWKLLAHEDVQEFILQRWAQPL